MPSSDITPVHWLTILGVKITLYGSGPRTRLVIIAGLSFTPGGDDI